eukprot:gene18951-22679_t
MDEDVDESGKRSNVESVIRWRWVMDNHGRAARQSNTRLVEWEDGSQHLYIGTEVLEMKEQELGGEQFYIYSQQDGFIECEGKLDARVNFRPTNIHSKVHKRLSESVMTRTKKVSKIKSIQTNVDPELEKEERERKEAEKIRERQKEENLEKHANRGKKGLTPKFLEEDDYEEEEEEDYDRRSGNGRNNNNNNSRSSRNDQYSDDDYEDEESDNYDEEDDFIDNSPKSKKRDREEQDNTNKLMKIKQTPTSSNKQSSYSAASEDIFGDDESDEESQAQVRTAGKRRTFDDD